MNPRRAHRRSSRRNPGNVYVAAFGAVILSLVVGTIESFAPNLLSKDGVTQGRIRTGLGLLGTGGGIALAKKHPMIGLSIAAPSFAVLVMGVVGEFLSKLLAPSTSSASSQSGLGELKRSLGALIAQGGAPRISAVYGQNLAALAPSQGAPHLSAVFHENMGDIGAVFHESMGDVHSAPWSQGTPFG